MNVHRAPSGGLGVPAASGALMPDGGLAEDFCTSRLLQVSIGNGAACGRCCSSASRTRRRRDHRPERRPARPRDRACRRLGGVPRVPARRTLSPRSARVSRHGRSRSSASRLRDCSWSRRCRGTRVVRHGTSRSIRSLWWRREALSAAAAEARPREAAVPGEQRRARAGAVTRALAERASHGSGPRSSHARAAAHRNTRRSTTRPRSAFRRLFAPTRPRGWR